MLSGQDSVLSFVLHSLLVSINQPVSLSSSDESSSNFRTSSSITWPHTEDIHSNCMWANVT